MMGMPYAFFNELMTPTFSLHKLTIFVILFVLLTHGLSCHGVEKLIMIVDDTIANTRVCPHHTIGRKTKAPYSLVKARDTLTYKRYFQRSRK